VRAVELGRQQSRAMAISKEVLMGTHGAGAWLGHVQHISAYMCTAEQIEHMK
jgi:hypothetical protein